MRIGVISDTHGWLDPAVERHLAGVDAILHAGDIGALTVVEQLARIAPIHAVRGNNDRTPDLLTLPEHIDLDLGGVRIHLVHRPIDARPGAATIVVTGHTHRPLIEWRGDVLRLNPGAAGRRGFHMERTLALLDLAGARPDAEIVTLGPRSPKADARSPVPHGTPSPSRRRRR